MQYLSKECGCTVAYDEVDFLGRLKPSAMLQYFQDAVEVHAYDLNITHDQMAKRGKFWVLSRIMTVVEAYPKVGQEINIITYPHKPGLVEAFRSFYIYDKHGKLLIRSLSKWCVLDIQSKRICRCGDLFNYPDEVFNPEKGAEFPPKTLADKAIKEVIKQRKFKDFRVNITDLDENLHMNNARYGDVMFNTCDFEELKKRQIESFDIRFLSELKYDDCYKAYLNVLDDYSEIDGLMEDKQVFSATVKWRK